MKRTGNKALCAAIAISAALFAGPLLMSAGVAHATDIKVIVNNLPITSYDIDRRVAFFKLQRKGGGRDAATQEMIDQVLKLQEMKRLRVNVSDSEVDQAYARFAGNNKLSPAQLDAALAQAGVTKGHFKDFIRSQIGWGRVLQARYRATEQFTEQDAVQKMLQQGGAKPTAREYMLQQVIFVIPANQKSSLIGKRKREAEALRGRFRDCNTTRDFAKGLLDVTVRDLGRVLEPELPPDWKNEVIATAQGKATPVRETNRGVEFIGVCSMREVSDDRVAQMVFQSEQSDDEIAKGLTDKYMKELRDKAAIMQR